MEKGGKMNEILKSQIFWFIWLNCAAKDVSLFEIQKRWKITSNFLYHKHKKLGKTFVELMLEGGYIERIEKKIKARFEWIEDYIKEYYKGTILEEYSSVLTKFCNKYNEILFDYNALRKLFVTEDNWKVLGKEIFRYIFFSLIYKDIERFLREHRAQGVKILIDIIYHISNPIDILSYSVYISERIPEYPNIISTKSDIEKIYSLIQQTRK